MKVKRWLASVMISTLITCGGGGPPSTPSTPAPSSPPALSALTATSAGFIDQNGEIVRLRGVSYIPPDSTIYGWPSTISVEVLRKVKDAGGNFVSVRLGPFSGEGELPSQVAYGTVGDRVDLDQWDPTFWARVRAFNQAALGLGIYVEYDLIDAWTLKQRTTSPWAGGRNVNGYYRGDCEAISIGELDDRQAAWLAKIAAELGREPNVLFQISNESDVCQGRLNPEWELAVYIYMKAHTQRPVGTNSRHPMVESVVDYIETHECSPPSRAGKPAGVNEWNCRLTAAEFCAIQKEREPWSWFLLWGDGMSTSEWEEALKCLG